MLYVRWETLATCKFVLFVSLWLQEQLYKEYLYQSVGDPFPSEGHMHS